MLHTNRPERIALCLPVAIQGGVGRGCRRRSFPFAGMTGESSGGTVRFAEIPPEPVLAAAFLWLALVYSEIVVRSSTISTVFWRAGLWLGMLFAIPSAMLVFFTGNTV